MNSLKTGFVVAVLLAAGFGAYEIFVKPALMPQSQSPMETAWTPAEIEFQSPAGNQPAPTAVVPASAETVASETSPASLTQDAAGGSHLGNSTLPPGHPLAPHGTAPPNFPDSKLTSTLQSVPPTELPEIPDANSVSSPTADAALVSNHAPIEPLASANDTEESGESSPPLIATSEDHENLQEQQPDAFLDDVYAADWRSVQDQLSEGHFTDALLALSLWYGSPDLPADQKDKLNALLDQLAGTVIYSTQHVMQAPYQVSAGETLEQIANHFKLPWQFLANVNGIADPNGLVPGQELKVVHGPFRAEIDLDQRELTLFLHRHYAGRFPIRIGQDPFPNTGQYEVVDRITEGRDFVADDGRLISAGDPSNPYGTMSVGLSDGLIIHSTPTTEGAPVGCIMVEQNDLGDIISILSLGSRIHITSHSASNRTRLSSSALGSTTNDF